MRAVLDFESRSIADLKECGHHVYSEHSSTDIICMAWALNDEVPKLWLPFDPFPEKLKDAIGNGFEVYAHNYSFDRAIWNNVAIPKYTFPAVPDSQWRCSMALAYSMGLPGALEKAAIAAGVDARKDMKASRIMQQISKPKGCDANGNPVWRDEETKFQSTYQYCLNDLIVTQKLLRVLLPLSKLEVPVFELDRKINDRGVLVDMPAIKTAIGIVESEKIRLDERMREATGGVVGACSEVGKLTAWIRNQGVEIPGVAKAAIEETLKASNLPPSCRQALLLRQESAKASTAKLEAMRARAGANNRVRGAFQYCGANTHRWAGRGVQFQNLPRVSLLTQPQIEEVLDGLSKNDITAATLETFYGPPMAALSDCIRGFLKAAPGKKFLAGDYSAIEARVLAWLAGEEKVLEIFRGHGKIYEAAASDIFNVPVNEVTGDQRQIGKTACIAEGQLVLTDSGLVPIEQVTLQHRVWDGMEWVSHEGVVFKGEKEVIAYEGLIATKDHAVWTADGRDIPFGECSRQQIPLMQTGFGREAVRMGQSNFTGDSLGEWTRQILAGNRSKAPRVRVYDIINAGPRHRFTVSGKLVHNCLACGFGGGVGAFQKMAANYGVKISDEKAGVIKTRWREANKKIVRYWYDLDNAARMAIKNPGDKFQAGHQGRQVVFLKKGSFLICKLPSSRVLFYPYPRIEEVETPWGEKKLAVTYKAENSQTRQWETQKTFPGFWSEQVTQSVARDILAEAMLRLDSEGWRIVAHSHDEIVCEQVLSDKFSVKELERIMAVNPSWAKDLPIVVTAWEGQRYRK